MSPQKDWRSLYPFTSRTLSLNGQRYHYLDEGQGEPLLLVHGNPTWSFYWRSLVSELRGQYRLVVPDHLGCGLSDKPAGYPYTFAHHVDNLLALVRRLDLRSATLVVHDWGGPIGLSAAVADPERFARLVILNTGAFPPPYIPWRIRACRIPILGRLAVQGLNAFARAALRMAVVRPASLSRAARSGLLAPYDTWQHREAVYQFVQEIPGSRRHPNHARLEQLERSLATLAHLPTLIFWGMQDWCFRPVCLERLLGHFPNAEVHRLAEVGHYVMEEAPEQVVSLVETFLQRNPVCKEERAVPAR